MHRAPASGFAGLTASPLTILWRKRAVLIAVFAVFTVTAAMVSTFLLEDEYEASTTLLITQKQSEASFDAVQAGEVLARTYAEIIDSENVANLAAADLPYPTTGGEVLGAMQFDTVPETQLV